MSHAVEPNDLLSVASKYGSTPYLLYSAADGSARVNHVVATVETDPAVVRVEGFGRGVAARIDEGVQLSLLWPAVSADTFSLIADGTGSLSDDATVLSITIDAAVLHRPAPVGGTATC